MTEETQSGAELLARREYAGAVPLLKAEHEKYPGNPRIHLQYADALAGAGSTAEAIAHYDDVAQYYEDNGLTVQAIAVRKKRERLQERADPEPKLQIRRGAGEEENPRSRVIAAAEKLVSKGQITAAIDEYSKLLRDDEIDVNTLNRIGDLWVRVNRNDEAVRVFTRIAEHYERDGFFLKAIAIYKKINKLDPSRLNVYLALAELYAKQGLAMEAKSQYQVLGDYYIKSGDVPKAVEIYERVSDLDPQSISVHVKLAGLYSETNQFEQALRLYDRVARMLLERGMHGEAVGVLRKALKLDPANSELQFSLARALYETRDYIASAEVLTPLLASDPGNPRIVSLLSRIHLANGEIAYALGLLEPLLARDLADAATREVLADCYLRQNDADRALAVLRPLIDEARQRGDHDVAIGMLERIAAVDVFQPDTQALLATVVEEKNRKATLTKLRLRMRTLIDPTDGGDRTSYIPRHLAPGGGVDRKDAMEQALYWIHLPNGARAGIQGGPGMGKTFLLHEFARRLIRDSAGLLPILIDSSRLAPAVTLDEAIGTFLATHEIDVDTAAVRLLLRHGDAVLLLDEVASPRVLHDALYEMSAPMRVIVATRTFPDVASADVRMMIWELLPLTLQQARNVLNNRWRSHRRLEQWFEIVDRDEQLQALCRNPSTLNLIAELDLDGLFQSGNGDPDSVAVTDVYRLLVQSECDRLAQVIRLPPDVWRSELTEVAVLMWSTGTDTLPKSAVGGLPVRSTMVRMSPSGVEFVHQSLLEWLVAHYAVSHSRTGVDQVIDAGSMSPTMVEFFCDLAGYSTAREWATDILEKGASGHARDNAEKILHFIGGAPDLERPVDVQEPSGAADDLENTGRTLLTAHAYTDATRAFREAIEIDPARAHRLQAEFGFLLAASFDEPRMRWCTNLWRAVTRSSEFAPRTSAPQHDSPDAASEPKPETFVPPAARDARTLGEELEDAVLRLFRQFFRLTENDEGEFRVQLQKLRRQKTGAQFGYDLAFEATVAGNDNVRCHIECKNYSSPIALKDVADKLLQQKSHGVHIDHWILVSPRTDASQDLHHFLEYESEAHDFPFDIHVWSPETNVERFFGLEPLLYEKFYAGAPDESHPRHWTPEKKQAVIDHYRRLLRPVYRLPRGWSEYVDDERHLAFSDTEQSDFARTYQSSVPLGVKDHNGIELPGTAIERLLAWLAGPTQRVAFVLGEFGDGKSFLTYSLSRQLLQAFRTDPDSGVIPLRLALREFTAASSVREFLQARLEVFGAEPAGWAELKRDYRVLVILDGFDEISKELDPATITKNIRALIDCCTAPVFDRCKILITSRTHFFETGDAPRLLQRLENPLLLHLARIPRAQVLGHLQEAARGPEERELLQRLARMHDPIGLGTKPLFLQMLKETLSELPADLDEVSVYESYARKTLERKIELLDDPEFRSGRQESIEQLLAALGVIAEELQCSKEPYVSLKKLRDRTGSFTELLWRLTGDEILESDAEARIGARSLLSRVHVAGGEGKWLVDFCHRSIREYFVARRFADFLTRSSAEAAAFLQRIPVNHEILYFTACHLKRSRDPRAIGNLRELLCRSTVKDDADALAGRALTVLLRVAPALPRDLDFKGRNFDYADLEDGDLSGIDFSGSTFKGANFANTNLEEADLSGCDLTGVRLNETTAVLALATLRGGRIFAAYEDGTVWEWDTASGGKPLSRIVYSEPGLKLLRVGMTDLGIPWGIAGREALVFDASRGEWSCVARIPLAQTVSDFSAADRYVAIVAAEKGPRCYLVNFDEDAVSLETSLAESTVFAAPATSLLCFRESELGLRILGEAGGAWFECSIATGNPTAIHALHRAPGEMLIATGESDGVVRVLRVHCAGGSPIVQPLFEQTLHSGPVLSLMLSDSQTLVSGGRDRIIALTPIAGAGASRNLQLSIRCRGLRTRDLRPEAQRLRLEELMARAAM